LNEQRKRKRTWEFCCETIRLEGIGEKKGLDFSRRRDIERHHIDPSGVWGKRIEISSNKNGGSRRRLCGAWNG